MKVLVQKYGGTSVGNIERIHHVADNIAEAVKQGYRVVVVVSAMSGETDRLLNLAHSISATPAPRELDVVLSTGEQVTIALLCMSLIDKGYTARSYTGSQVQILTDSQHNKARIVNIDGQKILTDLEAHNIVVVAGFQGIDEHGNITTLGRGGSDTTAVALAAALKAHECQIYTDVEGVYTTDPRIEPEARLMQRVTFEEMLEMSSLGAKVLQIRAVEFAGRYHVPLRVLSSFVKGPGTLISLEDESMEQPLVSGIAFTRDEAKFTLIGISDRPGIAAHILCPISDANIDVDMIVQNARADGKTDFTFTVQRNDYAKALKILHKIAKKIQPKEIISDNKIAKISLVGVGMRSHAGIASTMFRVLGEEGINIQLVSTSEIKVSVVMDEKYLELGVRTLHTAFNLSEKDNK